MTYIVIDYETYLRDPEYWKIVQSKWGIPLNIGTDTKEIDKSNDIKDQPSE